MQLPLPILGGKPRILGRTFSDHQSSDKVSQRSAEGARIFRAGNWQKKTSGVKERPAGEANARRAALRSRHAFKVQSSSCRAAIENEKSDPYEFFFA